MDDIFQELARIYSPNSITIQTDDGSSLLLLMPEAVPESDSDSSDDMEGPVQIPRSLITWG